MRASDFTVAVDDGHGQGSRTADRFDPGAVGNGRREADITQLIGDKMRAELRRRGCKTFKPVGLYTTRARQADTNGAHLLISNHLNAPPSLPSTANGTETFVHTLASARSRSLAAKVNAAIARRLGTRDRGVKVNGFSVLSGKCPSILIEWVFITNKDDLDKLDANMDGAIRDVVDVVLDEFKVQSTAPVQPSKPAVAPVAKPTPAPAPTPAPTRRMPLLRFGAVGGAVRTLQSELNKHGHRLNVDGQFGPKTRAAVLAFQRSRQLRPDGVVGPLTWRALGY